jgi:hypothetical protein
MMNIKYSAVFAAAVLVFAVSISVFAHHGTAAYDTTQATTVKGTVTDFQFINPHTLILLDVKDDKGAVEHWQVDAQSPNQLTRDGWSKSMLKPGDQISITGYRAKNGSNILRFLKMVMPDGREIKAASAF